MKVMNAMTVLSAAAVLFAGAGSVALAGQDRDRDFDSIRQQLRDVNREIAQERREIARARARHDWDKVREDRDELANYMSQRNMLRDQLRGEHRYYRHNDRDDWRYEHGDWR